MRKTVFLILILVTLVGCAPAPNPIPSAEPSPTPEPIIVALSPAVGESVKYILNTCAWGMPQIILLTKEAVELHPDPAGADLTLWWGIPTENPTLSEPDMVVLSMGEESVSIIVHESNLINSLSVQQIKDIYTAQIQAWDELSEDNPLGEIQVWAYPNNYPLRHVFDQAFIPQSPLTSYALLAPSPLTLLEAIQENHAAIGYIPSSFSVKDTSTKKIPLQTESENVQPQLTQPIVGILTKKPEGNLAVLVNCLQTNFP